MGFLKIVNPKDLTVPGCDISKTKGCVFFLTGLSGAGKTTLAQALSERLIALSGRPVSMIDGDEARKVLSSELGFSREHRDLNVKRMGYVAAEVARHGGFAILAAIAPYEASRIEAMARIVEAGGRVCLIHVSTSLDVCERRDPKGLYAKARAGLLSGFTGIDDPYEAPVRADLNFDLASMQVELACDIVEKWLDARAVCDAS